LAEVRTGHLWRGEVVNKNKDGRLLDVALTVAPLYISDNYNNPVGFVTVQRDITPLKKADRAKNEFVSNVAHELRTPLSVLTLISDNLDALYQQLDEGKRQKMIRDIQKHTQILNELINNVLEISRIDSGYVSAELQLLNLAELVQEEVEEILPLARQKSQSLETSGVEPLPVLGNSAQLRQVIRNLLTNAIKYTPQDGHIESEWLVISVVESELEQKIETGWPGKTEVADGLWAALRIVDTGIGIDSEHLPHIFERFYRVRAQQNIRGTGLGLAIVQNLIELHQGQIGVSSAPGEGSTFAIYLPLFDDRQAGKGGNI
jgi:signal transduction histidine kinase